MGNTVLSPSTKESSAPPAPSSQSSNDSCSLKADALKALEVFGLKDTPSQLPPAIASILSSPQGSCKISSALTGHFSSTSIKSNDSSNGTIPSSSSSDSSWSFSNPYTVLTESLGLPRDAAVVVAAPAQTFMTSFSNYLNEFISQHFIAIALGATVGAAVATGIAVGLLASASVVHAGANYVVMPAISQWSALLAARVRRRGNKQQPKLPTVSSKAAFIDTQAVNQQLQPPEQQQQNGSDVQKSDGEDSCDAVAVVHLSGNNGIWIIKGSIRPIITAVSIPSSLEQCRECLESIATSLRKHQMSLQHVRRWTLYLTSRCCKSDFVRALRLEYPQIDLQQTMISYFFVQQLEDEHAVVQMEAMASFASPSSDQ
jgi:hypothetical protein